MIEITEKVSDQDGAITTAILCEDSVDISLAGKLHEILIDAIESGHPASIDLSRITRIDTSCVQLLYAFYLEAKNRHLIIEWSTNNKILMETTELIGLGELFNLSPTAA
jgi:anti-anti-sigma regulatory factor